MLVKRSGTAIFENKCFYIRGEWEFDYEGQLDVGWGDAEQRHEAARAILVYIGDSLGMDIVDLSQSYSFNFYAERVAGEAIFSAQITSSPSMMKVINRKWWQFWKTW